MTTSVVEAERYSPTRPQTHQLTSISKDALLPAESHYQPRSGILNHPATLLVAISIPVVMLGFSLKIWIIWNFIAILYVAVGRFNRKNALRVNREGIAFLNEGRLGHAAEAFEYLAKTCRGSSSHAVYVFNRGVVYMLEGRHRRAFSLFNAVRRSRQFPALEGHVATLYADMATCLLLQGDYPNGVRYLEAGRRISHPKESPQFLLAEAILLALSGEFEDARRTVDREMRQAQELLRLPCARALKFVYAYVLFRLGDPLYASLIRSLGECSESDFEWLTGSWPDLREFAKQAIR